MKKRCYISIILFCIWITGCGISNIKNQTEYYINEEAFIDQYQISCESYEIIEQYNEVSGEFLKVNYIVTNNSKDETQIHSTESFKLYWDNQFYEPLTDSIIEFKQSATKKIEIVFDLTNLDTIAEPYKVIFYSGVASNNIASILEEKPN